MKDARHRLRRGFKTEAEAISKEVRGEMRLSTIDPLDSFRLAEHLEIPTVPLSRSEPELAKYFRGPAGRRFSALTLFITETQRLILFNDYNSRARQNSDVAHECGHALLHHVPREAFSTGGCRDVNNEEELEASWLGGTLLVHEDAALAIATAQLSLAAAATKYGVSQDLMRWRLNKTAAFRRAFIFRKARTQRR